jgi:hypothetical protein
MLENYTPGNKVRNLRNPAAAVNAPVVVGCHAESRWRRVTDQRR